MGLLSQEDKETIAGRARTLQERLDGPADGVEAATGWFEAPEDVGASIDEYVEEWRDVVADGDDEVFERRLARENLDLEACRRRIADDAWPRGEPLPGWVDHLDDLLGFVVENPSASVASDREFAFVDVLAPVLAYARQAVGDAPPAHVSESAMMGLTDGLANRLTRLWSRALFIEFKTHVASDDPDLVFGDAEIDAGSTRYYDEFTDQLLDGGLRPFFIEYSFLGRLFVSVLHHWVDRVREFLDRVVEDWPRLREGFADGAELGPIAGLSTYGDPHQEGREVFGVTFDSGTKVAYKPRNAGIVVGFYELLEWVNDHGDLPDLRTLSFVSHDEYAWMEWVDPAACETEDEAAAYYRRAGMLVCLFYALAATDMHLENIIAEGGQPVAVDLETLAEPVAKSEMRAINETVKVVAGTVVRTGVVPRHVISDEVGDMAGFSVHRGKVTREGQQFTNANTDRMDLEMMAYPDLEGANLPEYAGEVIGPRDNVEEIVGGFEAMYRFVLDNEHALLGADGPIERLTERESRIRVLYRPTAIYGQVIDALRSTAALRTGVTFGIRTEALAKLVVRGDVDPAVWSIYEAERAVLRQFNTPRFTAKLDSTDLFDLQEVVVEDFFRQEPVDQVRERIASFSEADLEEQVDYINWGYGGYQSAHTNTGAKTIDGPSEPDGDAGDLAEAAAAVFGRVVTNARTENGDPTWIRREVGADGGLHVHPIDDRLYDGRVGIGLFAAALDAVLGDDRYGEFARETVAPIVRAVEAGTFENDPDSLRYPPRPVGGGVGLGSIVYGLTKIGVLVDDATFLSTARRVAELIDRERIEADDRYDVLSGSGGAILGLLALFDATGDGDVLDRATMAGDHLLESGREYDGALAWPSTHSPRPLCGFSHGVAGIAYALFRLGDASGASRFEAAALDGIEYEGQRFDAEARNWPDLRAETGDDWFDAWCHGRTGIGLARLGMYELDPAETFRRDVDRALEGVDPTVATENDHLCCGNFGRVEFLLRAGRTLGEPAHGRNARRLATARVRRAAREGRFATQWGTDNWYNPSLFDGEAGVGYSLLRIVDDSLPCVLLWE